MSHPVSTPARAGDRPADPRWALAGLALAMLLASLGTSIANVALPTLVGAFDASFPAVQWVVLGYLLAMTVLAVNVGRLGDLFGRRRLLLAGLALFTVASVACGAAPTLPMLIAARVGQGFGAAVMTALALALVGDAVPPARAGRAMGWLGTLSAVGTALGPSLGGALIATAGWRGIFLVNVPLGALALVLAVRFLPADAPRHRRPAFDFAGAMLLASTLAAYALAMTVDRGMSRPALLLLAFAGAALFVVVQTRRRSPLVPLALLRHGLVGSGFAMGALATTVAMTTLVVGPFHLGGALGLGPAAVGAVMTTGPLVAALAGVPAGRGVDRFGARRMMIAGLAALALGAVAMSLLPVASGVSAYVLALAVTTAGFAGFQAANNAAVVTGVAADERGVASGLLTLARNLGLVTGASAMGAVFAAGTGVADITDAGVEAIAAGTRAAFAVGAALAAVALVLAIGAGRATAAAPAPGRHG